MISRVGRSSFTTRIALLLVSYLTLGLLALGLLVYLSVQQQLMSQAKNTAVSQLEVIQRRIEPSAENETGEESDSGENHADVTDPDLFADLPSDMSALVFDASGNVLNHTPNAIQVNGVPFRRVAEEATSNRVLFRLLTWRDQPYLFAARRIATQDFLAVFIPYATQERFLRLLTGRLVLSGLLVLLLVGGASYALSRRALRPVLHLTTVVEKLGSGDFKQRALTSGPDDELQRLGKAFNRMAEQLERAFARERQFVSDASHELRTPLAVIEGYARLLHRWGKEDPHVLNEGLVAISESTGVMKRLVTQLLRLARDEQPEPVDLEPVSLGSLVQSGERATKVLSAQRQLTLEAFPEDKEAWLDPWAARECLLILLENAVKYTPDGGKITLRVVEQKDWRGIQVTDTGPGIASEHLDKVFDRFYRVDPARSRQTGASGLGLSIAKHLMEAQNGRISVESEPGKGSRFTLFWPSVDSE